MFFVRRLRSSAIALTVSLLSLIAGAALYAGIGGIQAIGPLQCESPQAVAATQRDVQSFGGGIALGNGDQHVLAAVGG